jgi:uncharacterized repeat protein (TIGR03806 family)
MPLLFGFLLTAASVHGAFYALISESSPQGLPMYELQEWPNATAFAAGQPASFRHGQRLGATEWDFRAMTRDQAGHLITLQAAADNRGTYDLYRWSDALRFTSNEGDFLATRYRLTEATALAMTDGGQVVVLDKLDAVLGEHSYRVLRWDSLTAFGEWADPVVVGTRQQATDLIALDWVEGQWIGLIATTIQGQAGYEIRQWTDLNEFLISNGRLLGSRISEGRVVDVFSDRRTTTPSGPAASRPLAWPWLGNRMPATRPGAPGSLSVVEAFPGLTFQNPVKLLPRPDRQGELWVAGREGHIWSIRNHLSIPIKTQVLNITNATMGWGDSGLLGFAFHPEFGQSGSPNRGYIYVAYNAQPIGSDETEASYNRLSRFTLADGETTIRRGSELILINQFDRHPWHNQGDLYFGEDGFLYLGVGDEGELNNALGNAQRLDGGLFSGVLRIDVDQNPARSHPIRRQPRSGAPPPAGWPESYTQGYFIPNDNPWLAADGSQLEEFWAIGLRNPYRMTRDPVTQQVFIGDVGQTEEEEINVLTKAANYQWAFREGDAAGPSPQPNALLGTSTPPLWSYSHRTGNRCVIGGYVYRGSQHRDALEGQYLFADYVTGRIWAMDWQGRAEPAVKQVASTAGYSLSGFGLDHAGELYLLQLGFEGRIMKLTAEPTPQPPALLSATGAFDDLTNLTPARELIPYEVNAPLWSDGASKKRWMVLPSNGAPYSADEVITFRANAEWDFPVGTVLIKHFEMPGTAFAGDRIRRLETRFMVKTRDGGWYGVTYRWRADGSDADLLATGQTETLLMAEGSSGTRNQTWTYPSRNDCMQCHNSASTGVLGLRTWQVHQTQSQQPPFEMLPQIQTWNAWGLFDRQLSAAEISQLPRADSNSSDLETRARSYLDANCASCHRPGGAQALFDARFSTPIEQQGLIDGPLTNSQGMPDAKVIHPGNPDLSMIFLRMMSEGSDQMPPLGRHLLDPEGINLIYNWIESLRIPATPIDLTASRLSNGAISLTWRNPTTQNPDRYQIEHRINSGPWIALANLPGWTPFHTDSTVPINFNVAYRISATVSDRVSAWSDTVFVNAPTLFNRWQDWQQAMPDTAQNQPLDNPDGDSFPNLLAFAFGYAPTNGGMPNDAAGQFAIFKQSPFEARFSITRPVGLTGVTMTLMAARTLSSPMQWTPVSIPAQIENIGNKDIVAFNQIQNDPALAGSNQGFLRWRVRLDATGDEAFSPILFWSSQEHAPGAHTYAPSALNPALIGGRITAGSTRLDLATALAGQALQNLIGTETAAYLEIVDGPYAGHRFDVDSTATADFILALQTNSPHNTMAPIPDLTGARFFLRHHRTLQQTFANIPPIAGRTPVFSDRVQLFDSNRQRWLDFWNYGAWVSTDSASLEDQGATVIPPGAAMIYRRRISTVSITDIGELRETPFLLPLPAGVSFIGSGWPITASPESLGMTTAAGFIPSRNPALADRFMLWRPDFEPGANEGFHSWFLVNLRNTQFYWTSQDNANLVNANAQPLFQSERGFFMLNRTPRPAWRFAVPWQP